MSTPSDCSCPRDVRVRQNLALAALLIWVSNLAYGGDVAPVAAAECPRPVIAAGRLGESAACLQPLSTREQRGPLLTAQRTLRERVDLVARDVSHYVFYSEVVRMPSGSGALDTWSLVGGVVLLIAFAGMRRRQLFRDG